jgi:hypothetical protein
MQSELKDCGSQGVSLSSHETLEKKANRYARCPLHLPMLKKSELVCNLSLRPSIDYLTDSSCGSLAVPHTQTDGQSVVVSLCRVASILEMGVSR